MTVAQRNMEIAYLTSGYSDARVGELREFLRTQPSDHDARWELGRTLALLGQHAEAMAEFKTLPQVTVRSDIHCVTRWSRFDNTWRGVAFTEVMQHVTVKPEARFAVTRPAIMPV